MVDIAARYARQLTKARIDTSTANRLAEKLYDAPKVFSMIDRISMKARLSGMTTAQIISVIDAGTFQTELMDERNLIVLKPYLEIWPENPKKASMAFKAGLSVAEINKMGKDKISEESLQVMISLN